MAGRRKEEMVNPREYGMTEWDLQRENDTTTVKQ